MTFERFKHELDDALAQHGPQRFAEAFEAAVESLRDEKPEAFDAAVGALIYIASFVAHELDLPDHLAREFEWQLAMLRLRGSREGEA